MREIKFRAWDKENQQMVEMKDFNPEYFKDFLDNPTKHDLELMQFTGLKDKNGKEIYEGDILKIKPNSEEILIVDVIFHNGCFCYKTKEKGIFAFYSENDWAGITKDREVIDNIYENPEVLK